MKTLVPTPSGEGINESPDHCCPPGCTILIQGIPTTGTQKGNLKQLLPINMYKICHTGLELCFLKYVIHYTNACACKAHSTCY